MSTYQIPTNLDIAQMFSEIANLLEIQHADPHRIRAYRNGARLVRESEKELAEVVVGGDGEALKSMPGIGDSLSRLIIEYVRTGKCQLLLRLKGEVTPEALFEEVPGIGHELAERIVRQLGITTLEDLEQAAHDGRLAKIEGFGSKRVEAIQMSLAGMMSGFARRRLLSILPNEQIEEMRPTVESILEVDKEYRQKSANHELKMIAPRRFNPDNIAWLPILHSKKDGWDFTALFSNTLKAHELGKTKDWVVIYYEKEKLEGQATVVTETSGPLAGKRVVRGREIACKKLYFPTLPIYSEINKN